MPSASATVTRASQASSTLQDLGNADQQELKKALHLAKVTGATLVIAKLDRLSRNAAFLLTLRDSGVRFSAVDLPRRMTSPLALWLWWLREAIARNADRHARDLAPVVEDIRAGRATTCGQSGQYSTGRGMLTRRGGRWHVSTVTNLLDRLGLREAVRQSRMMSLVEALANVVVGRIGVALQIVLFPVFGFTVSIRQNLIIGLVFTAVSIVRSYALRRIFEMLPPS